MPLGGQALLLADRPKDAPGPPDAFDGAPDGDLLALISNDSPSGFPQSWQHQQALWQAPEANGRKGQQANQAERNGLGGASAGLQSAPAAEPAAGGLLSEGAMRSENLGGPGAAACAGCPPGGWVEPCWLRSSKRRRCSTAPIESSGAGRRDPRPAKLAVGLASAACGSFAASTAVSAASAASDAMSGDGSACGVEERPRTARVAPRSREPRGWREHKAGSGR